MRKSVPFYFISPNSLTFFRIIFGLTFFFIYTSPSFFGIPPSLLFYLLFLLLSLSEVSDILDGYFARKYDYITEFGKVFDPIVDSLTRNSIFLAFTKPPISLPLSLALLFFYRDAVTHLIRIHAALRGVALPARRSGKIKAIIQATALFALLFLFFLEQKGCYDRLYIQSISRWIVGIVLLYGILSCLEYLHAYMTDST